MGIEGKTTYLWNCVGVSKLMTKRETEGPVMRGIERCLVQVRWLLLAPAVALIIGAGYFAVVSVVDVFKSLWLGTSSEAASTMLQAVDAGLLSAALVTFGLGLYELFISRLEDANSKVLGRTLTITSLDDLKDRLGKIILLVLIVRFFDIVADIEISAMLEALIYAGAVALLALSLWFIRGEKSASDAAEEAEE